MVLASLVLVLKRLEVRKPGSSWSSFGLGFCLVLEYKVLAVVLLLLRLIRK